MVYSRTGLDKLKTAVVMVLCSASALYGGYRLRNDFRQSAGEGQGPVMAKIERSESKVRRKPSHSFVWSNAQSDEKLYRRDSVQTSVGSGAAIRYTDGTLLELGENSLVVIEDVEKLSLEFVKGSVVLHTTEGDKHVTVGEDGKAKFEELPVRLTKPEPLARYFTGAQEGEKPVHFAWKVRKGQETSLPESLTLEVSADRAFRAARTRSFPIGDAHATTESEATLAAGTYFWRLTAKGKVLTEVSQFRIIEAQALRPTSPGPADRLSTFGEQVTAQFRWMLPEDTDGAGQARHEIQIATDAEFAHIERSQEISASGGSATLRGLGSGKMWWRIVSRYGDLEVKSAALGFVVDKEQRPALALTLPEAGKTIEKIPGLRFSWRSDTDGLDYLFEVKNQQGKPVVSEKGTSNAYVWKQPASGTYLWRVSAMLKDKNVAETDWRGFSVFEGNPLALQAPAKDENILYWSEPKQFEFRWSADALVAGGSGYAYELQLASEPGFKDAKAALKTRETHLASDQLKLSPGQYYWRIRLLNEAGEAVKASEAWKLSFGTFPELAAPVALAPASHTVFELLEKPQNPVVSWEGVKDAEIYEVSLYRAGPGRVLASENPAPGAAPPGYELVLKKSSKDGRIELKELGAGEYLWSVRAVDPLKRLGRPMSWMSFSVSEGDVLGAPESTTEEVQ